ncbi:carbohydrate ABC transporter substrate-binding protein (CUT1 family) [Halopolyspora algeriensis]|uniref:Carbohydrate ABC transporter substrate-binding protein (CUT1 family) n=1 Tax=Halopolyspora algeriensis TaxID=1500506 RepID=A0A368VL05_9ACTN|nr:sugar ABC transporter substrate-binding protein [Halopolyspora algeriensis]RCW40994.1 carbohydrate ABC transporter substrate-binding protein (CUT1 family) [Halopolyspora algeriensis]TQM53922.1 carbohydrate ABC transporter substrate-binding protein (CUT1 family) [Halopolyspora algeriensis]
MRKSLRIYASLVAVACLALSGCAGAGALGSSAAKTVTIAMVSNPQMQDAIKLASHFEERHPGIDLKFVSLSENEARAKITVSTAMQSGQFDVVMVSNYETRMWAENGWLRDLSGYAANTPGYDVGDFVPSIRESLSYRGDMYSMPFYGESSFLMYRKDLFRKAGITMPEHPTWQQITSYAKKLHEPGNHVGICLRGKPGWGEVLAPLDTVINTFGGRWYDENWNARLDSPAVKRAVGFYVNLVRKYGEPSAATTGFAECGTQFSQGNAAMWYDATSAVSIVENPKSSRVADEVGYVAAPTVKTEHSNWLYTWSLGIPTASDNPDAAWEFISWVTSKDYIKLVGRKLGWSRVPPGSRMSTYEIPQYRKVSEDYAALTLQALRRADPENPTVKPVPYSGAQFLQIPEFQDLGTRVSQQISAAIAGKKSVAAALEQAQQYAEAVGKTYQEQP